MALTKRSLAVPAEPPSVPVARVWVADVLTELGRPELVDAAELGVSELLTNAILHAQPPVTVSVAGTVEHPRIEVTDHTPGPLRPHNLALVGDEDFPTTFGRGLALVALNAAQWGSETDADGFGKRVWFEPAAQMREDADLSVMFHDADLEPITEPVPAPPDSLRLVLLNVPAQLFAHLRRYHFEVRRELRLLALSDPGRYPIAVEAGEVFRQADAERRKASGVSKLDAAIAAGVRAIDLEYAVVPTAPRTMAAAHELLERCYELFADEYLLTLAPPDPLRRLQSWYFGEFVRQGRGEEPIRWDGPTELSQVRHSVG